MAGEAQTGSSMLTDNMPPPIAAVDPAANGGTPDKLDGAQQAVQNALDAPPDWAPKKYWDEKTKQVRYEDLGRGYQNLEKLLGGDRVPKPVSDDDEEGWQRWYAASGRPEAPDKYDLKRPEKLPDGLDYDEDLEKEFRTWAHVNGLNKKQATAFYDGWVKRQVDRHAAWDTSQKQARSQSEQALRREHGAQYEAKMTQAKVALREFADPDYLKYLDETGKGNDPREIRVWMRVGEKMMGETRLAGKPAAQANPADLDKAIADFRSTHQEALFKREHPDHDRRVREYNKLFEQRYGE